MIKFNLSKSLYLILLLLFGDGFRQCISTAQKNVVNEVELLDVGLAKTVHCVDYNKKVILQCKPRHVLIVHSAQWSNASCEQKNAVRTSSENAFVYFNRTEALQQLCDGFNYCFLRPTRTRDDQGAHTFLGDPLVYHKLPSTSSTENYSLTLSVSCLNRDLSVKGRKVTDTLESRAYNIDIGCNEGEVIHLSLTRVDGFAELGPNRSLTQYNFGPYVFDCHMKQKCQITHEVLSKCESEGKNVFGSATLVYYCRRPLKFSFCDHVKVTDTGNTKKDKFVLYAEQDSQVVIKAPMFYVLKSESAVWSTSSKLADDKVKKDRLDLLKFLCDNRNFCAFIPKRSAAGQLDTSFEEVHFGGILREDQPLVLLATFSIKHVKDLNNNDPTGLKSLTAKLSEKITLTCEQNEEGTIHVLSAIGGPTNTTNPNQVLQDQRSVKFKDLTKVLYKICYRKRVCDWNLNPNAPVKAEPQTLEETGSTAPGAQGPPGAGQGSSGGTSGSAGSAQGSQAAAAAALQVGSLLELSADSPAPAAPPPAPTTPSTPSPTTPKEPTPELVPAGLDNQELTVKYICKKYTHDPSLIDLKTAVEASTLLQMSSEPSAHVSTVEKEQALLVSLELNSRLFVNLEVFGGCTVLVGNFFKIEVPDFTPEPRKVKAYFTDNDTHKYEQDLTGRTTKFVFYLGFTATEKVDFAFDASDGLNDNHYKAKVAPKTALVYPIKLVDVVKATGSIVGMRVYMTAN